MLTPLQPIATNDRVIAVYFHGVWADSFDPAATQSQPFQISPTLAATANMMQNGGQFAYYAQPGANGFQAMELPYLSGGDDWLEMLVILPTTYDLSGFESSLTPADFSTITSNLAQETVELQLPRFDLTGAFDLSQPLQALGITSAFTPSADFSGISNTPTSISDVIQKSYISVDESGTTAAAATGTITITPTSVPTPTGPVVSFDADHPFLFAITDEETNTILFLGNVNDPSNQTADYSTPATPCRRCRRRISRSWPASRLHLRSPLGPLRRRRQRAFLRELPVRPARRRRQRRRRPAPAST